MLLGFSFSAAATGAQAQTQGENVIWASATVKTGTTAAIDASAFCPNTPDCDQADICSVISQAINVLPAAGGVVDARGVVYPTGLAVSCATNPFPQSNTVPVTLLLPSSVIDIQATWVLPSNTRIIGEGRKTILRATGPTFGADSKNAMIEMLDGSNLPAAARVLGV